METIEILDVTVIEPRLKHPTIFEKFDALIGGQAFIIHNDHDPKPLYYQLLGERGNIFKWEYLENGPETWKVRITKYAADVKPETIGELVAKDFRRAEVFKKYGIDFCCGGKKTLEKACSEKGLDVVRIEDELKGLEQETKGNSNDFKSWDPGFLADYILNTHHKYVNSAIPVIYEYTQKVANVHGDRNPEVVKIAETFLELMNELNRHMCKEEDILFPYIKELALAKKNGTRLPSPGFGTVENPVRMMEHEHDVAGDLMLQIKNLSNDFTPPQNACTTFRLSYAKLKEFEEDLHTHIHLENNILFPAAIKLEKELI
jgi:regulator of cell morphogenesis and NO signaling